MHKKELRGWLKHIDFIVLDIIVLQILKFTGTVLLL